MLSIPLLVTAIFSGLENSQAGFSAPFWETNTLFLYHITPRQNGSVQKNRDSFFFLGRRRPN